MKFISWNVNGLRACVNKGFMDFFESSGADVFCVQETKMQKSQADFNFAGHCEYWNDALKKGYSGTLCISKEKPENVFYGLGSPDDEGRALTLEFKDYYLVNIYAPNSQSELERLEYRLSWQDELKAHVSGLKDKMVIICGDLNVAHNEIDLKNPKSNRKSAGFTDEERAKMTELLDSGFTDTFRNLNPDKPGCYTWWAYFAKNARENNTGWRIDYFLISEAHKHKIKDAMIYPEIMGSDHCPVGLLIE